MLTPRSDAAPAPALFSLPSELLELAERARALADGELSQLATEGTPGSLNRPLVARLGSEGLLERAVGADRAGSPVALSVLELCVLRESLARHCTEAETAFALQGLGGHPIISTGEPAIVERWAGPIARGEAVAAFALSEPQAGSDIGRLSLAATPERDGYRLHGSKTWISNAPHADVYTVFARTGEGSRGLTAFAVSGDADGLSGESIHMLSPHPIGRLRFDGVRVTAEDVLGEVGGGFAVAMATLNLFRPSVGAFGLGMAQAALDLALHHTARREAFGAPLRDRQAVSHRLAELATRLEAARLLVYRAAAVADESGADPRLSAMAKLLATETAQQVVDAAIQVHGAVALEHGHPLEHLYREVRAPRIYEGASEIQREIVARSLYRSAE